MLYHENLVKGAAKSCAARLVLCTMFCGAAKAYDLQVTIAQAREF